MVAHLTLVEHHAVAACTHKIDDRRGHKRLERKAVSNIQRHPKTFDTSFGPAHQINNRENQLMKRFHFPFHVFHFFKFFLFLLFPLFFRFRLRFFFRRFGINKRKSKTANREHRANHHLAPALPLTVGSVDQQTYRIKKEQKQKK